MKKLIVNADDLGLNPGVNAGIRRAHEHGIVTSASLMVRQPAAAAAARWAASCDRLSVGLHVDLGEWRRVGMWDWEPTYQVVDTADVAAVEEEIDRQLHHFRCLLGRDPTHLDSHQHLHIEEPARSAFLCWSRELQVPLRMTEEAIRYEGRFYGQDSNGNTTPETVSTGSLLALLGEVQTGSTELCCHPGDGTGDGEYMAERGIEVETLCNEQVREAIDRLKIRLCTFAEAMG